MAMHVLLQMRTFQWVPWHLVLMRGYLPAGPFGVLGAIVYAYMQQVPPLWTIRVGELEVSDRVLVWVLTMLVRGTRSSH